MTFLNLQIIVIVRIILYPAVYAKLLIIKNMLQLASLNNFWSMLFFNPRKLTSLKHSVSQRNFHNLMANSFIPYQAAKLQNYAL